MNELEKIAARMAEIGKEIETRGEAVTAEEMTAFEKEVKELEEKRAALIATNEKRAGILGAIANGTAGEVKRGFTAEPSPVAPTGGASGTGENRSGVADKYATAEYRRAFMEHVLRGKPIPAEFRADEVTYTTDIGAVIPTTTLNTIVEKMESVGMILPLVTRTAYRGGLSIPASTAKPVATWVAEGAGSEKQKKTTGSITFNYYKLRCAVAVSLETDTMALSAFETTLINNVVEAMTKEIENAIINGDGDGKPTGILNGDNAPAAEQTISSATASYSDLIQAEAALPQAYENGAVWCMSKKTFMTYYGLQDETGQPIGRVNYGIAGKPERTLLGRPVVCCDYIVSYGTGGAVAGSTFAFLFNFKDYILNTNYQMGIKKYQDDDTDDWITRAIMLTDGKPVDNGSLVVIKKA